MSGATGAAGGGAVVVPAIEPVDLATRVPPTRAATLRRSARIAAVMTRRLGPVLLRAPFERDRSRRQQRLGAALHAAVLDLGGTFVKLGQLLASSPSVAGEVLANAMRGVLDAGPAVPFPEVRRIVEHDLGRPLDQVYARFDPRPFAAASLAVVHKATLIDGTDVAVKVLRPDSATVIAADLGIVQPFARLLARQLPIGMIPAVPETLDGLAEQLAEELDLRNEARVMAWFSQMFDAVGATGVVVPATRPDASGPNVLTMEYIDGSKVDDLEAIGEAAIDARAAIEALIEAWFALALCTGVFHGDMHAGNLLLTAKGEVALLDWGIVGRLPAASRFFFRRSLEGALGDESAWPDVRDHMLASFDAELLRTAGITPDDFMALVRAQTLMIMTQPFRELDLMTLMPAAGGSEPVAITTPTTVRGWVRHIREERKRVRDGEGVSTLMQNRVPPRGELLLVKQLVFFERYGKLFLSDQPLLYDPDVYRALLARPDLDPTPSQVR